MMTVLLAAIRHVQSIVPVVRPRPNIRSHSVLFFLTLPYPVPAPKNYVIFIGCNFKSRASQAGLHKEKKDTASAKKGKVRLQHRGGRRLKAVL